MQGLQGRYFIPAAPLLLAALTGWRPGARAFPLLRILLVAFSSVILLITLRTLVGRYYV